MTIALYSFLLVIIVQAVIILRQHILIRGHMLLRDHLAAKLAEHYIKTGVMVDIDITPDITPEDESE